MWFIYLALVFFGVLPFSWIAFGVVFMFDAASNN